MGEGKNSTCVYQYRQPLFQLYFRGRSPESHSNKIKNSSSVQKRGIFFICKGRFLGNKFLFNTFGNQLKFKLIKMIISPFLMLFGTIIYFLLLIPAFMQMMRNETGINLVVWLLMLIFLPFAGAALYLIYVRWNKSIAKLK